MIFKELVDLEVEIKMLLTKIIKMKNYAYKQEQEKERKSKEDGTEQDK
jgi:hypothetical protein